MTDHLARGFKTQLTAAMDSFLRRTVLEIMRIFETSLHDHQMELAQKGEEVAHLRIKLQTAEVKLRECECGGDRGAEMNKTQMNETQREPEVVLSPSGQTSEVPEIDFEVPDDWCAPLGCETATKQDDAMCPSIRLRKLSIPLWPISVIKQEVANNKSKSHQQIEGVRRSKRGSSLNESQKATQPESLTMHDQGTRYKRVRNNVKKLLKDLKKEYSDQAHGIGLRTRGRNSTAKEHENTVKSRRDERKFTATKSEPKEQKTVEINGEKRYSCKCCKKVFDTALGRSVHVRSHRRCQGCKKEFPFPSTLRSHKRSCEKLKKLLAKEALRNPPKPGSCGEEKLTPPSKKQVIIKNDSSPSENHSESSIQKDGSNTKYCAHCNRRFRLHCRLKDHMCVHISEKMYPCSKCPKKFHINQSLKKHMARLHQDKMNFSETNRDLVWTKPLEDTEDN